MPKLNYLVLLAAIAGLVFVIGCGASKEEQQMTDFIQKFSNAVDEYAQADASHKAELKAKMDSYMSEWTQMKFDMGGELTPQALEKLDAEYQQLANKYKTLSGKS